MPRLRDWRWALAAVIGLAGVASAAAEPRPFRLMGNQIVMSVRIEGRETLALLDTGANVSLMTAGLAAALGVKHQKAPGGTLGVSGQWADRRLTPEIHVDLGDGFSVERRLSVFQPSSSFAASGVEAIIGMDMLYGQMVTIDFERFMIDFAQSRSSAPPVGRSIPFTSWEHGRRTIRATLGDQVGHFLVDTGASSALHLFGVFEQKTSVMKGLAASQTLVAGMDGTEARPIASLPRLAVGGETFENVPVTLGEGGRMAYGADGVLGVDLLKRFNVVLDYRRNRMWLTPNANADKPFRRNRIGVITSAGGGRGTVRLVAPGSPAERAGFRAGEVIAAFEDAAGAQINDLMAVPDGETVSAVMSDGSRRTLVARTYY